VACADLFGRGSSASNGWIGRECENKGEVTDPPSCKPAPGKEGIALPASGPKAPGTCTPQAATAENGCIVSWCTVDAPEPTDVALESVHFQRRFGGQWLDADLCTTETEPGKSVPSCSVSGSLIEDFKKVTACGKPFQCHGHGLRHLRILAGWGRESNASQWLDHQQLSQGRRRGGGLSYLQSEADFAACEASKSTAANGVEIQCIKDGPHTVTVLQGEACIPGYNASTKKVTDCAGVGHSTTEIVADKPANCSAATCEEVRGRKKTYQGQYWFDRMAMTGTIETGTSWTGSRISFSGDLESPARCYAPEEWAAASA
jgi:hypothetical protein